MLPGNQIFAKEKCKTFEEATDLAVESLRKQIEKHKTKKSIAAEAAKKAATYSGRRGFLSIYIGKMSPDRQV
jgi:putative sigma-54 modulation protein